MKELLPFFSIVMPIYNAERDLVYSIGSVMNQKYENWELILVDDCSKDNSIHICKEFISQDDRIVLYQLKENSGNAKFPREYGIQNAKGQFVVFIDSDDEISIDYLDKIYLEINRRNPDVIISKVHVKDHEGLMDYVLPDDTVDVSKAFSGKEACLMTLPVWHICCNGMALRRELYDKALYENPFYYMNSDEYSTRILLFNAKKVVFSTGEYFFYQNRNSITHKHSIKLFDVLIVDGQLLDFAQKYYERIIVENVGAKTLSDMIRLQKYYYNFKMCFSDIEKNIVNERICECFKKLKKSKLNFSNWKSTFWSSNITIFKFLCYIGRN